jgi:hypothetical protein
MYMTLNGQTMQVFDEQAFDEKVSEMREVYQDGVIEEHVIECGGKRYEFTFMREKDE